MRACACHFSFQMLLALAMVAVELHSRLNDHVRPPSPPLSTAFPAPPRFGGSLTRAPRVPRLSRGSRLRRRFLGTAFWRAPRPGSGPLLAWGWGLSPGGCGGRVFSEASVTGFSAVSQTPGAPAPRASPEVEGWASSAEDPFSSFRGQAGPSSGGPTKFKSLRARRTDGWCEF